MPIISGVLKDGAGQPVAGCTIQLKAVNTTGAVIATTTAAVGTNAGKYHIAALPARYEVTLVTEGFRPQKVGVIDVYADSPDGSLNDFLTATKADYLTPDVMNLFKLLAQRSADAADAAETAGRETAVLRDAAEKAAVNAALSDKGAEKSALVAKANETAAAESAAGAAISATGAASSAASAKSDAAKAAAGKESAATSAAAAAVSATTAQTAASDAGTSKNEASASASAANTSANAAKASETAAKAGQDAAALSAANAAKSGTSASVSASQASASAAAAQTSQAAAKLSETNAGKSAQTAAGAAATATTAATQASASAAAAQTSQAAAKQSETNAGASAASAQAALRAAELIAGTPAPAKFYCPPGDVSRWAGGIDSTAGTPDWKITVKGVSLFSPNYLVPAGDGSPWEIQHPMPGPEDFFRYGFSVRFSCYFDDVSVEGKDLLEVRLVIPDSALPAGWSVPAATPDKQYLVFGFIVRCVGGKHKLYDLDAGITSPDSVDGSALFKRYPTEFIFGCNRYSFFAVTGSGRVITCKPTRTAVNTPENTLCFRPGANQVRETGFNYLESVITRGLLNHTLTPEDADATFYCPWGYGGALMLMLPDIPFPEGFRVNLIAEDRSGITIWPVNKNVTRNGVNEKPAVTMMNDRGVHTLTQTGKNGKTWLYI